MHANPGGRNVLKARFRGLRGRLDPVAQGQPPFTTMADLVQKQLFSLAIRPKVASSRAMHGRLGLQVAAP